jgi:predicted MFS family arabinose efflux permease
MTRVNGALVGLLTGAGLSSVATGIVLPFLLADIATARGYGTTAGSAALTAFAIGTIAGSYAAGRLATRSHTAVAAGSKLAMTATLLFLGYAHGLALILLACLLLGVATSIGRPALSTMLLHRAPEQRRRDVFGWFFVLMNAGMAAGAAYGGLAANLHHQQAMHRLYLTAAAVGLVSAAVIAVSGSDRGRATTTPQQPAAAVGRFSFAEQLRCPGLARVFAIQLLLALALYAQFNAGLPALVLTGLHASTHTFGLAVAINACLVAAITTPVVAITRKHNTNRLLAASSSIWLAGWLILALPLWTGLPVTGAVIVALVVLAVGETTYAPVMTPLAASLVPDDQTAAVTATMATIFTTATTIGPLTAGILFAATGPTGFAIAQLLLCAAALLLARRLQAPARIVAVRAGTRPTTPASPAGPVA